MIRSLAFLFVVIQTLALGPLYFLYGEVDPCRALAAENAKAAKAATNALERIISAGSELDFRRQTATLSYAQCFGRLVDSWTARVTSSG
jgi:hypothetical protein